MGRKYEKYNKLKNENAKKSKSKELINIDKFLYLNLFLSRIVMLVERTLILC